jgi:hypothetical protein
VSVVTSSEGKRPNSWVAGRSPRQAGYLTGRLRFTWTQTWSRCTTSPWLAALPASRHFLESGIDFDVWLIRAALDRVWIGTWSIGIHQGYRFNDCIFGEIHIRSIVR